MNDRAERYNAVMDELRDNLLDIYKELVSGQIPCVLKVGELSIA